MPKRKTDSFVVMCAVTILASAPAYGGGFINGSQLSISGDATVGFTFLHWACNQPGDAVCVSPPANTGDFSVGGSTGSFAQYNSTFGKIKDLTLASEPLNQLFSDPGWITFDTVGNPNASLELTFIPLGSDTPSATCAGLSHCTPSNGALITATNPLGLSAFNLDQNATGTAASFGVFGIAHDLSGTPSFSFGGIFSAQFTGLNPQQVLALVGPNGAHSTYSANITIAPTQQVLTGRMTGGGWFMVGTDKVTHGFELHCETSDLPNNLEVNWGGNHFHLDALTGAACFDTPPPPKPPVAPFTTLLGAGPGTFNGVAGAFINFGLSDHGEPGTKDTVLYMMITDAVGHLVLNLTDPVFLGGGNHQAHKDNK